MRSVVELKSLGDIRTTISTHSRSTPRHKATTYLEILSLGMEKQRLQAEMAVLGKRQHRIDLRLAEIREAMGKLVGRVEEDRVAPPTAGATGSHGPPPRQANRPAKCREVTVGY